MFLDKTIGAEVMNNVKCVTKAVVKERFIYRLLVNCIPFTLARCGDNRSWPVSCARFMGGGGVRRLHPL